MFLLDESFWEIKDTEKKGRGVFAKKDIPAGTIIGDYLGKVIRAKDEEKYEKGEDFYLMFYHYQATIYPNPKKPGIHIINHSCSPNTWMYTYRGHTLYFSIRHIFSGEELSVSYLLSPQDENCDPCTHLCHCESPICTLTMHLSQKRCDEWNTFEEKQKIQTKREPIHYGKQLPTLSSYPENIPDNDYYTLFGSLHKDAHVLQDTTLPKKKELRNIIRTTGRTLLFPHLNLHVLGIHEDLVISKRTE